MNIEQHLPPLPYKKGTRVVTEEGTLTKSGLSRRSLRKFSLLLRLLHRIKMTNSKRLADKKIAKFQKNITKRGSVPETSVKKGADYPVGPIVLGFFVFVVIGSSLFQIIRTATSGGMG